MLSTRSIVESSHATHFLPTTTPFAVGDWNNGEFAVCVSKIECASDWFFADDPNSACKILAGDQFQPQLILLAQPLPGSIQQREIEQLRRLAPLAKIVVVAGSWCEGELRTGQPLTGVLRLYWYEFLSWWPRQLESNAGWSPSLDGPLTPRDFAAESNRELDALAAVHTPSLASFETIAAALGHHGLNCVWAREDSQIPTDVNLGLWDGGQLDPSELAQLQTFASTIQQVGGNVIVLLDFPRKEHFTQLRAMGIHTIFGKPYIINELVAACPSLAEASGLALQTTSPIF
jgi:hypothetical protein